MSSFAQAKPKEGELGTMGFGVRLQMNISLIRAIGRFNVARQFIRLVCGTHIHHPQVQYFPATALDIEAVPAQAVSADGDLIGRTPVRIEIKPRAIIFIRSSS